MVIDIHGLLLATTVFSCTCSVTVIHLSNAPSRGELCLFKVLVVDTARLSLNHMREGPFTLPACTRSPKKSYLVMCLPTNLLSKRNLTYKEFQQQCLNESINVRCIYQDCKIGRDSVLPSVIQGVSSETVRVLKPNRSKVTIATS